jgi:hypothetical protein
MPTCSTTGILTLRKVTIWRQLLLALGSSDDDLLRSQPWRREDPLHPGARSHVKLASVESVALHCDGAVGWIRA